MLAWYLKLRSLNNMSAITPTLLTFGNVDSASENQGDQTTASISPTSGTLVVVGVASNKPSTTPNAPTISGLSLTWAQAGTATTAAKRRVTLLYAYVPSTATGALTISHGGQNQQDIYWIVTQLTLTKSSTIIVQQNSNNAGSSPLTISLSSFGNVNNIAIGFYYLNDGSPTPSLGTGLTNIKTINSSHVSGMSYGANVTSVSWTFTTLPGGSNDSVLGIAAEIAFLPPFLGGGMI